MKKLLKNISPKYVQNVHLRRLSIILNVLIASVVLLCIFIKECIRDCILIAKELYTYNVPKAIENIQKHWKKY